MFVLYVNQENTGLQQNTKFILLLIIILQHNLLIVDKQLNVYNCDGKTCLDCYCENVWEKEETQELIINRQPHNIKFFDDKIGILPQLKEKYKEMIQLSLMGLFQ